MPFFGRKKNESDQNHHSRDNRKPGKGFNVQSQPHIIGINWLGLKTADITGKAIFLEQTLGLSPIAEGNTSAGHHVRYQTGGLVLELAEGGVTWALKPKPRMGSPDIPLIPTFVVDDIEAVAADLREKEVQLTQVFDQGWVCSFLFFDPDRVLWQVTQINNQPPVGTNTPNNLGVVWLAVEDLAAQLAFYRDVLGLPLVDLDNRPRPITEYAERQQAEEPPENATFAALAGSDVLTETETVRKETGAVFFATGTRLALAEGGRTLEDHAERVWGKDNPFMLGFRAHKPIELAQRLKADGINVDGPYRMESDRSVRFHFTDPEGNVWRVTD